MRVNVSIIVIIGKFRIFFNHITCELPLNVENAEIISDKNTMGSGTNLLD